MIIKYMKKDESIIFYASEIFRRHISCVKTNSYLLFLVDQIYIFHNPQVLADILIKVGFLVDQISFDMKKTEIGR